MAIHLQPNQDEQSLPEGHPNIKYQTDPDSEEDMMQEPMDALAALISRQWDINKEDKIKVEQEMLSLQKAVNCQYDYSTLNAIKARGGSTVYIPLTSMQCNAGASWLLSVINPPGDKAFTFKSTPVPALPQSVKDEIKSNIKNTLATKAPKVEGSQSPQMPEGIPAGPEGEPIEPTDVDNIANMETSKLYKEFKKESAARAERMEAMVADQLQESGWLPTMEDFITDFVSFHTAFIKTSYEYKTKMAVTTVDGQFTMESKEELVEKDERVSPFDIYPSPDQTSVHDGRMIERLKLSKSSIYKCLDKPGYSNENILKVLAESGTSSFADWQSSVDSSRRQAENHSTDFSGDDGSIYGLRFCGSVSVEAMLDWGYSSEQLAEQGFIQEPFDSLNNPSDRDLFRELEIDAILIGNHVIKAVPNLDPEGKRQYYAASYRKVPGSFWGKSIAMLSDPHQRMVNASARALSNNMGIASGPQIVVFTDRLPNGESISTIEPLKIWQMVSDPQGANQKPVDFFQPDSNAKELMAVYQYYFDSVGDVTGIPKQAYSSDPTRTMPGAQTASGLAMLLETASKQIKQAVRNIDTGILEPRLRYQYRTNMTDPEVPNAYKGDMSIEAIGAKSIVAKAVQNQRNIELLQATANPMDMEVLGQEGRAALLRSIMDSYDMSGILPTADEMEEKAAEAASQPQQPSPEESKLQIEQIRADVRLKDQELENQNAEAQRKLDLQIAQLEFEAKEMDLQIAQVQNKENNQAKMQEIALKEKNKNARFNAETAIKQETGEGI